MKKIINFGISLFLVFIVYFFIWGICFGIFILMKYNIKHSLIISSFITLGIVIFQYLISTRFHDYFLRKIFDCEFTDLETLPENLKEFIKNNFEEKKLKLPKIGIIRSTKYIAFSYGNSLSNVRIVLSRNIIRDLNEQELKAIISHELSHIFGYDFIFMTFATVIPTFVFYLYLISDKIYEVIYDFEISSSISSRRFKFSEVVSFFRALILLCYTILDFFCLHFSRIREYYADKMGLKLCLDPDSFMSAFIKIGHNLIIHEVDQNLYNPDFAFQVSPYRLLTILDHKQSLTISLIFSNISMFDKEFSVQNNPLETLKVITQFMQWDTKNPWSIFYEIFLAHPLFSKRIFSIYQISKEMGLVISKELLDNLENVKINYSLNAWVKFFVDFLFEYSYLILIITSPWIFIKIFSDNFFAIFAAFPTSISLLLLIKLIYCYYRSDFHWKKVSDLLSEDSVSVISGIPVIIKGKINFSSFSSQTFNFYDETGCIYILSKDTYHDSSFLLEKALINKDVLVKGYLRRKPEPYVEILEIEAKERKKYKLKHRLYFVIINLISMISGIIGLYFFTRGL